MHILQYFGKNLKQSLAETIKNLQAFSHLNYSLKGFYSDLHVTHCLCAIM